MASWKYGALAIVALVHDVLLVVGIFSFLGKYYGIEVDTAFVVAVLTVLGYSVNDTIVVYDRIRENLLRHSADNFSEVVNNGLNQTLMRSINTTVKTLLPLFALYFIGGASIHNFALALLIGIASGAYSSIFIASPLLVVVYNWQEKNKSSNGIVFSDSSLKRHLTNFYIFLSLSILSLVNLGTRHMVESRYGFNDAGFVSFLLGKIMATVSAPLAGAVITFFNLVFSFAIIWIPITVIEYRKVKKLKNLK